MNIASLIERRQPGRKVQGIAAALLPYEADGRVAVESFKQHLIATHQAGLMNAVNMDTGYVNYLSESEKRDVLRWTAEALGKNVPFVAGAYIENQTGDIVALYRQQMDIDRSGRRHSDPVSDVRGCMAWRPKKKPRSIKPRARDTPRVGF